MKFQQSFSAFPRENFDATGQWALSFFAFGPAMWAAPHPRKVFPLVATVGEQGTWPSGWQDMTTDDDYRLVISLALSQIYEDSSSLASNPDTLRSGEDHTKAWPM